MWNIGNAAVKQSTLPLSQAYAVNSRTPLSPAVPSALRLLPLSRRFSLSHAGARNQNVLSEKRQLNAEPRNFEAAVQPIDVGFAGQAGAIRRGGGRSWRPPSQDRTAWARIRRQR